MLDLYLHEEVELGHIKRSSSHYLDTKTQRCSEKKNSHEQYMFVPDIVLLFKLGFCSLSSSQFMTLNMLFLGMRMPFMVSLGSSLTVT